MSIFMIEKDKREKYHNYSITIRNINLIIDFSIFKTSSNRINNQSNKKQLFLCLIFNKKFFINIRKLIYKI